MPAVKAKPFRFEEQIQFFLAKSNVPTQQWTDVWKAGHDTSFMVAGAYKAELLADLRSAVEKTIANGGTLADFRKDFDGIVARHGWNYNGGRGWRTRVIFETNLRTSYQAGRYAQLTDPEFLKGKPFWRYKHSEVVRNARPEHVSWDGLVIAAADPWWQAHYPPNGWGCKCTVYAESAASAKRRGYTVTPAPPVETVQKLVGKNGPSPQTVTVPKGIDPGWDYAPGASVADRTRQAVAARAAATGGDIGKDLAANVRRIPDPPPAPVPAPASTPVPAAVVPKAPAIAPTPKAYIAEGEAVLRRLDIDLRAPDALPKLRTALAAHRPMDAVVKIPGRSEAAEKIREASRSLPDSWLAVSDAQSSLKAASLQARARSSYAPAKQLLEIATDATPDVALHELMHHLQFVIPALDAIFEALHRQRTAGADLKPMRTLLPHYSPRELTREDSYFHPYQGREYRIGGKQRPLEVITMAFQAIWGGNAHMLQQILDKDPEMVHLVIGTLWSFDP